MIALADIEAAAAALHGHVRETPVWPLRVPSPGLDHDVLLKCENLQRMGAFKFRGAFNALAKFSAPQRQNGVVTFSSGNHAQAIAL
ncbi:MAG TPA: pyridoxal-phosphate dependent enzyme, partial [Tepidiformaceae bacterium]|nr:pyridoxal-phosphate dependent enzyme [Tepidiformaceae bacterium]